jgi:hypothetical protein
MRGSGLLRRKLTHLVGFSSWDFLSTAHYRTIPLSVNVAGYPSAASEPTRAAIQATVDRSLSRFLGSPMPLAGEA